MAETDRRPAITLLLADAFRFTESPTEEGRAAFLDGMRLLWEAESPTLTEESNLFSRPLDTDWQVTANFDAEQWVKLGLLEVPAKLE